MAKDVPAMLRELGVHYDPERLAEMFRDRRSVVYGRALTVSGAVGGFVAALLRDWAVGALESNAPRRARQLARMLSGLGPSFVKIGQALSSRPDLLPQTYLEALAELQDRLEPFPSAIAFTVIEDELERPLTEVYSEITPEPVAAASLGQVYKATLAATGETVAVKVQRPGIGESIAIDMLLLRRLMALVDSSVDVLSQPLVPLVDEFAARLFGELDYVQEGQNCERFTELYRDVPRVRTPGIRWEYTSRRVLTMEWIDGVKLTNKPAMDAAGLSITDFVDVGIECTLRQLLEHGYFHADPHPGNLLATREGDLVYLDFGMMSEAPEYARYAIIAHVVHLVNRDYDAMCRDYYTLQFMDPSVDTSPIAPELAAFFDDVLDSSVSELNFKAIVDGLGAVLFAYPFRVPAYYALILRSLTVLEGLALSADRNYKLLARAYPYMARRLLTDPEPELRATFEELMLKDGEFRWNRLVNLLNESAKSADFSGDKLWTIADWFLSDSAETIRTKVSQDLVKMTDASVATIVRQRIEVQTGSAALAARLVPQAVNESRYQSTALSLQQALEARTGTPLFRSSSSGQSDGPGPNDIQASMRQAQAAITATYPRLQTILRHPNAQRMLSDITISMVQRAAARSARLLLAGRDVQQQSA